MERSLVIVNITDLPQCETSITHDAVPVTVILKIESLQRYGTLWHPLEIWRCKKSFLQKYHFAEWAVSNLAPSLSLVKTVGEISSLVSGTVGC